MVYQSLKKILKEKDQLTYDDIFWLIEYVESKHSRVDSDYRRDVLRKLRLLTNGSES